MKIQSKDIIIIFCVFSILFGAFFALVKINDHQVKTEESLLQQKHEKELQEIKAAKEAKLAAMTPEERRKLLRDEEAKKKKEQEKKERIEAAEKYWSKFYKDRDVYESIIRNQIINNAYDPDSLIFKEPYYPNDGVCIIVNGKNRFGAYVGFKYYCAKVDKRGKWKISQ